MTGKYKPQVRCICTKKANATAQPHLGLDMRVVENFEPVAHFTSIPAMHEIGAARDIENCQIAFDMLENVDEHTLHPVKHPGQAATHSSHECTIFNLEWFWHNLKTWRS